MNRINPRPFYFTGTPSITISSLQAFSFSVVFIDMLLSLLNDILEILEMIMMMILRYKLFR
jgi:hypothetical protein